METKPDLKRRLLEGLPWIMAGAIPLTALIAWAHGPWWMSILAGGIWGAWLGMQRDG